MQILSSTQTLQQGCKTKFLALSIKAVYSNTHNGGIHRIQEVFSQLYLKLIQLHNVAHRSHKMFKTTAGKRKASQKCLVIRAGPAVV